MGCAVRQLQSKGRIGRMRQTGQSRERLGRNKLGFAAELQSAHDRGQIHVAAALAGADQCALHLHRAGQNRRARVGDAQAAVGVAVESEPAPGYSRTRPRSPAPLLRGSRRRWCRTPRCGSPAGARTARTSLMKVLAGCACARSSSLGLPFSERRTSRPWRVPDRRSLPGRALAGSRSSPTSSADSRPASSPATSPRPAAATSPRRPRPARAACGAA